MTAVITGTGLFTPPYSISNDELVAAFNAYVDAENARARRATSRAARVKALERLEREFIVKASGIRAATSIDRTRHPRPRRSCAPRIPERSNDEPSIQCEMAVDAAREALDQAGRDAADVDARDRRVLEPAARLSRDRRRGAGRRSARRASPST